MLSTSAMFDSLCDEKKRLLLHTIKQQAKKTSADREQRHQLRQQMNSVNKRLHAVVQHMSAFDRYKRKKKYSTAEPRTTTQHAVHLSPSPTSASQTTTTTTNETIRTFKPSRNIIELDVFNPLRVLTNQTVDVGKKFAEILQIECTGTRLQQLTELEQSEPGSVWSTTIGHVKQCAQLEIQLDREAGEAHILEEQLEMERKEVQEQARIRREQRAKERQLADEQVRLQREQRAKERKHAEEEAQLEREQRAIERKQADEQAQLEREQFEKETREAEELYLLQREQRDKEKREADEQDRLQVERAEREMQERIQKEHARMQLQIVKSQADCRCRLAWLERFPLVTHRRANQTANAG